MSGFLIVTNSYWPQTSTCQTSVIAIDLYLFHRKFLYTTNPSFPTIISPWAFLHNWPRL